MQSYKRNWLYYFFLGLVVLTVFQLKFGLSILLPSNDAWLYGYGSDMLPDICTWEYYRYSPPVEGAWGVFKGYAHPQVTGIGNTNIVPLIGMPLKAFNQWLPEHFQYFGLFLFACYGLQAWFADRLLAALKLPIGYWRCSAVVVTVLAAPFLDRFNHLALCAHWLILAALATFFATGLSNARALTRYTALSFASVLIHPYLILFPLMVAFADGLQRMKRHWTSAVIFPALSIAGILSGAYLSGIFSLSMGSSNAGGFGEYSSNLNTFWNNIGKTNFAALNLPTRFDGQYEGYAYLGAGVLVLWITLLLQKRFYRSLFHKIRQYWPLMIVSAIALVYACAFMMTINKLSLFDPHLDRNAYLYSKLSIFRSSGRYIWLPYYIIIIVPFVYYGRQRSLHGYRSVVILICILLVQIADMAKAVQRSIIQDNYKVSKEWPQLAKFAKEASTVYTHPLYDRHMSSPDDMQYLTAALAPGHVPITAGHLPRPDGRAMQLMIDSVEDMMDSGHWNLDPGGILITTEEKAARFILLQERKEIAVRKLGQYRILYPVGNRHADSIAIQSGLYPDSIRAIGLAAFLEENKAHTMIILTVDEASRVLQPGMRAELSRFSPVLGSISGWEAYAAIWHQGKMLKEQKMAKGSDVELDLRVSNTSVRLRATSGTQSQPYLEINGAGQEQLRRGVTVFVLDDRMQLLTRTNFDLFETYYGNR